MLFEGSGNSFVTAFQERIHHILEANGAFFDGKNNRGHAQRNQNISFNTIQPYPEGDKEGMYPTHHYPALKKFNRACRFVMGCGGHPGMKRSTGSRVSRPSVISSLPRNGPPDSVQLPTAMTTRAAGWPRRSAAEQFSCCGK